MNPRVVASLTALFIISALVAYHTSSQDAPRTLNDQGPLARQVYTNTAQIHDMAAELARIEAKEENKNGNDVVFDRGMLEKIKALEVTVAAHDKLLWVVVAAVIGLLVELGVRLLGKKDFFADSGDLDNEQGRNP